MTSELTQAQSPYATFTCASWNIHRGKGADGRTDASRIAQAIRQEISSPGLDALILQEADEDAPPHRGFLDIGQIERDTDLRHAQRQSFQRWGDESHGFLGVIVFLHPDWTIEDLSLLDLPGHCHRGAVIIDARREDVSLRLVATHLSLSQALRVAQLRTIGQNLFRRRPRQTVLCGDLNEWRPWGGLALSEKVIGLRLSGPAPLTFPVGRPLLPLDRILASAPARVIRTQVIDGPTVRKASDHRPIRAEVRLSPNHSG